MLQNDHADTEAFTRRRVLFVGHGRTPDATAMRKWDAVAEVLEIRVVVETGEEPAQADGRFVVVPPVSNRLFQGPAFYARLPAVVRRELGDFSPHVVVTQSPFDAIPVLLARRLARAQDIPLVVEVHGDWRSATRYYGSRWRRFIAPIADYAALWALRRATAIRAIGPAMTAIAERATDRPVLGEFPTFFDADIYFDTPTVTMPTAPSALFIGALQATKNPSMLASAWRTIADKVPEARLVVVGSGPQRPIIDLLRRDFPKRVDSYSRLEPIDLRDQLDAATMLVLPSRSEGLGRVVIEAFARGRPVIGTSVGGILDLVEHEVNGLLVPSGDANALASAMLRLLSDKSLAKRLGHQARTDAAKHRWTAETYVIAIRQLIEDALVQVGSQ